MNICRLCLSFLTENETIDQSVESHQIIMKFFNIQIDQNDPNVPHNVCEKCSTMINKFNEFHNFVLTSQEKLLDRMKESDFCVISGDAFTLEPMDDDPPLNISDLVQISHNTEDDVPEEKPYAKYRCQICDRQLFNKDEYDVHQMYHEPLRERKSNSICFICGKELSSEQNLTSHLKTHIDDPQNCVVCGNTYGNEHKLEQHQILSHTPRVYLVCQLCGRICSSPKTLEMHFERVHKEKESARCVKCSITFKDFRSLQRHNRNKHSTMPPRYKCKFCGKGFNRKITWDDHEASHTGRKKYECEFCGRRFVSNPNYTFHRQRAHPEEYAAWKQQNYVKIEETNE